MARTPGRSSWPAWHAVLLSWLVAAPVHAYCRTTTCDDCPRDEDGCTIGGTEVSWPARCVALGLHADASESVDFATVEMVVEEAFATWNAVRCEPSGQPPSIELLGTRGPVLCGRSEFVSGAANANVLVFRDETWPHGGSGNELATTSVRSRSGGEIVDADIEINSTRPLLVGDAQQGGTITGAHDLLSIVTHELGHLLGLDHSSDPDSIMQIELPPRVVRATLGDDDMAALCAIYPPEREAPECDPTPRGSFAAQCALDPSTGGACSAAYVRSARGGSALAGLWVLALVCMLHARRTLRRRAPRARVSEASPAWGGAPPALRWGGAARAASPRAKSKRAAPCDHATRARLRAGRASTASGTGARGSRRRPWRRR
jgi:hypothetical protein